MSVDVLENLDLTTLTGKFMLHIPVKKPIMTGGAKWEAIELLLPQRVINVKQYKIPYLGGVTRSLLSPEY